MDMQYKNNNELPIDSVTDFVAEGWDKVGMLTAEIKAIEQEFPNSKEFTEVLQELADEYLVCIGKASSILDKKYDVDIPDESSENEEADMEMDEEELGEKEFPEDDISDEENIEDFQDKIEPQRKPTEQFEYFVDFDEPDLTEKPLTDEDIYGKNN